MENVSKKSKQEVVCEYLEQLGKTQDAGHGCVSALLHNSAHSGDTS